MVFSRIHEHNEDAFGFEISSEAAHFPGLVQWRANFISVYNSSFKYLLECVFSVAFNKDASALITPIYSFSHSCRSSEYHSCASFVKIFYVSVHLMHSFSFGALCGCWFLHLVAFYIEPAWNIFKFRTNLKLSVPQTGSMADGKNDTDFCRPTIQRSIFPFFGFCFYLFHAFCPILSFVMCDWTLHRLIRSYEKSNWQKNTTFTYTHTPGQEKKWKFTEIN